jgi:hypothetical protein
MRYLGTVLMLVMATALAHAKQVGETQSTARPRDPPKSSITTPDRLLMPQGVRHKARGKTLETMIPDICTGC